MRDGLPFAEQSCRSGSRLEFRDAYGIDCERISQKFSHEGFGAMMGHGLPLSACLEIFHGWIATLAKCGINPLHASGVSWESRFTAVGTCCSLSWPRAN
jgi:hypothetical protein